MRVRRSEGVERAQLKWFVAAMFAVGTLVTLGFLDGGLDVGLAAGTRPTVFDVLAVASLSLPALAVGVAILRYHLFEIDRIISRTLSWALVTGLLGVVFVGLIVGLQALSTQVTGTNTLAVAASTLVVAAAFQPLRRRVQTRWIGSSIGRRTTPSARPTRSPNSSATRSTWRDCASRSWTPSTRLCVRSARPSGCARGRADDDRERRAAAGKGLDPDDRGVHRRVDRDLGGDGRGSSRCDAIRAGLHPRRRRPLQCDMHSAVAGGRHHRVAASRPHDRSVADAERAGVRIRLSRVDHGRYARGSPRPAALPGPQLERSHAFVPGPLLSSPAGCRCCFPRGRCPVPGGGDRSPFSSCCRASVLPHGRAPWPDRAAAGSS